MKVAEIEQLDLSGCRLAVLYRVPDDRGPEIPEKWRWAFAGVPGGKGPSRGGQSTGPVEDEAACEFAKHFLREVTRRWQDDTPCNYAAAMTAARGNCDPIPPDRSGQTIPFIGPRSS